MTLINYPGKICLFLYAVIAQFPPAIISLSYKALFLVFFLLLLYSTFGKKQLNALSGWAGKLLNWFFSDSGFITILCLGIFLLRIPSLLLPQQNLDEEQWIVTAATFLTGETLWKDIHGFTSG